MARTGAVCGVPSYGHQVVKLGGYISSEGDAKNRDVTKVRDHQGSLDVPAAVSGAGSAMGGSQALCLEEGMTPVTTGRCHSFLQAQCLGGSQALCLEEGMTPGW